MLRNLVLIALLVALAYFLVPPEEAPLENTNLGEQITGSARVVDGDTFWIGNTKIRLFGVDAPEAATAMGPVATRWLESRVAGRTLSCVERDVDRYGRIVATCYEGGQDIAEQLTQAGLAQAYRRFSMDYVPAENRARGSAAGIWAATVQVSERDCPIKGNISNSGRFYHMPSDRSYANTQINTSKGERWFCTEAEALAAGWKPAP